MDSIKKYELYKGDCLEYMSQIESNSIDLILCDLPYGTTDCKWDNIIDFDKLWEAYNRIIKENGAIVLFSAQPFTTKLIHSNLKNYRYSWYWIKNTCTGFAFVKYQPMRKVEEINVFYKKKPIYIPQGLKEINKIKVRKETDRSRDSIYNFDSLNKKYMSKYTNYPKNTLYFSKETNHLHPTQKPVDLLEYLIKTYTKEGNVVLDNCIGSGSTGVAAANTNRKFIGIELNEEYFKIAKNRIEIAYSKGVV